MLILAAVDAVVDVGWVIWRLDIEPRLPSLTVVAAWLLWPLQGRAQQGGMTTPTDSLGVITLLAVAVMTMGAVVLKLMGWIGPPKNGNGKQTIMQVPAPMCPATAEFRVLIAEMKSAIIQGHKEALEPYMLIQNKLLETIDRKCDVILQNQSAIYSKAHAQIESD